MEAKDVFVSVTGIQNYEGVEQAEPVVVASKGSHFIKGDRHYVLYDESIENGKYITHNTLKIGADEVEFIKKGPMNSHMRYEKGKNIVSYVSTPYGTLKIENDTKDIVIEDDGDRLLVKIAYVMSCEGDRLGDATVTIEVVESIKEIRLVEGD